MLADVRLAARLRLKAKGWTVVVIASLAIGTGANVALFTGINGLMLRKLAVNDPDGLVRFRHVGRNDMATSSSDYGPVTMEAGLQTCTTFSYPMLQQLRSANQTMVDMFAGAPIASVARPRQGSPSSTRPRSGSSSPTRARSDAASAPVPKRAGRLRSWASCAT